MDNPESYVKILNLIEITLPHEPALLQMQILDQLSKHLNPSRAAEGLKQRVVQRILKAFHFQPTQFQPILFAMMRRHLEIGGYQVDVPLVIALIDSPYENLQNLGMKIFTVLSDPSRSRMTNSDISFENHVKMLLDLTLAREKTHEFANHALLTIANLALKDSLRPQILHHKGIEVLLAHLRNPANIEGQRTAAKALLNLSISSRNKPSSSPANDTSTDRRHEDANRWRNDRRNQTYAQERTRSDRTWISTDTISHQGQ